MPDLSGNEKKRVDKKTTNEMVVLKKQKWVAAATDQSKNMNVLEKSFEAGFSFQ